MQESANPGKLVELRSTFVVHDVCTAPASQAPAPTLLHQGHGAAASWPAAQDSGGGVWTRARVQYAVTRALLLRGAGRASTGRLASASRSGLMRRPSKPSPADAAPGRLGSLGKRARGVAGPAGPPSKPSAGRGPLDQDAGGASSGAGDPGAPSGGRRAGLRAVQLAVARGLSLEGAGGGGGGGCESLAALAARVEALRCALGPAEVVWE